MALSVAVLVGEAQVDSRSGGQGQDPQGQRRHRAGTDVGPLVSCAALSRVEGLIERGMADGATLELDGRKPRWPATTRATSSAPPSSAASSPA
jgi:malonate-semialdehyde dehydrogenase (acetylating)/methylmalonate-semialdehyde dehydrogenase